MKLSVINLDAVKEIISCDRIFTDTVRSFCGIPSLTPSQFVEVVAFLIGNIISEMKNQLFNFIWWLKIKCRTLTK